MSAPTRPGAPRSGARTQTRTSRPAPTRVGPPARPGQGTASGAVPRIKPRLEAAPVRGSIAALLSWRTLVLAMVLGLAFALVWPSLRVYVQQTTANDDLRAERDAAQAEVDDLNAELARWEDPNFVVAQARERLAYVFPGETPYRVVDPELAQAAAVGSVDAIEEGQDPTAAGPWYDRLWSTLEAEGGVPTTVPEGDPAAGTGAATNVGSTDDDPEPGTNVDLGG